MKKDELKIVITELLREYMEHKDLLDRFIELSTPDQTQMLTAILNKMPVAVLKNAIGDVDSQTDTVIANATYSYQTKIDELKELNDEQEPLAKKNQELEFEIDDLKKEIRLLKPLPKRKEKMKKSELKALIKEVMNESFPSSGHAHLRIVKPNEIKSVSFLKKVNKEKENSVHSLFTTASMRSADDLSIEGYSKLKAIVNGYIAHDMDMGANIAQQSVDKLSPEDWSLIFQSLKKIWNS